MAPPAPPPPKSLLGRHRLLAPTASVRVSPLCLGGMSFGSNWSATMGECTKETAFEILDTFYDLGGNFIDTANAYQHGQSEEWIGEWLTQTGRRDEMVISTKYTLGYRARGMTSNIGGTGTKSMFMNIEKSLQRLQTSYVDLVFCSETARWLPHVDTGTVLRPLLDYSTDIPELMRSLNILVRERKVLYLGISDTPAWIVVKANCYAQTHGLAQFSVYQGRFSAQARDLEGEIIPMCRDQGMAVLAWGVMGNGYLRSPDDSDKEPERNTDFITTGRESRVSRVLDAVAKRIGRTIYEVAIAYVLHKAPYIYPLVGGRFPEHLKANVNSLNLRLTEEDIAKIETGYDFDPGFPHNFISMARRAPQGPQDVHLLQDMGHFDHVQNPRPIPPQTLSEECALTNGIKKNGGTVDGDGGLANGGLGVVMADMRIGPSVED